MRVMTMIIAYEVLSDPTVRFITQGPSKNILIVFRNAKYMIDMARYVVYSFLSLLTFALPPELELWTLWRDGVLVFFTFPSITMKFVLNCFIFGQEGLKAHEGGHHQANPFDIFSAFFGGGRKHRDRSFLGECSLNCKFVDQGQQVRRGPTSLTEFEVQLADMCVICVSIPSPQFDIF